MAIMVSRDSEIQIGPIYHPIYHLKMQNLLRTVDAEDKDGSLYWKAKKVLEYNYRILKIFKLEVYCLIYWVTEAILRHFNRFFKGIGSY